MLSNLGYKASRSRFCASLPGLMEWARAMMRAVREEGLDYRAASLAYTTLLSIVPCLAFSLSLLKAFGVNRHLEPFLVQVLAPLGDNAPLLVDRILDFVTRINTGLLGFVGVLSLIYIVLSMLGKIEKTFNHIWRVTPTRSFVRRAGDYLSVVLLGPVLIFSGVGLTASMPGMVVMRRLVAQEPFGTLFFLGGKLLSLMLVIAAFTFVYLYIPNTRVPLKAALFGGVWGGLVWKLAGFCFAHFIADSANYHALYSGLVIMILFMIWLEVSWLILLLGGQAAMYFQHPHFVRGYEGYDRLGCRGQEGLGLSLMMLIGERYLRGDSPWTLNQLAERLHLPWDVVKDALAVLQSGNLVEETGRGDDSYLPARDLSMVTVSQIRVALREAQREGDVAESSAFILPEVVETLSQLEQSALQAPRAQLSLRNLILKQG